MSRIRGFGDLILLDYRPTLQDLPTIIDDWYRRLLDQEDRPAVVVEQAGGAAPRRPTTETSSP